VLSRLDGLIVRERVLGYSVIFLALTWLALLVNGAFGSYPLSLSGEVVAADYFAHWTGAQMVLHGQTDALYDPAVQAELQHRWVPGSSGLSWFVSPPVSLWLYLPLGWMPYGVSVVLWTGLTLALLALCLRPVGVLAHFARSRDHVPFVLVFLSLPAVFELLGSGQDSAVALAVLLVGLRLLLAGRDTSAGLVLALGIVKPQLFVLVPLALLVQRRYRAAAAMAVGSLLLVASTLPLVGWNGWGSWLAALRSPLYQQGVQVGQTWKMQSVSALLTDWGAPQPVAYLVLALGAVALTLRLRQVGTDFVQVWALTVLTTVVFSPHAMLYDLVLLLPFLSYGYRSLNVRSVRLLAVATCVLLWSIPIRHVVADGGQGPVALLDAAWSAVALLALWVLAMRGPVGARAHLVPSH
jgi:hypothetical protein